MKRLASILLALFLFSQSTAQPLARPKLVVGIVIDQMRWDYLYRYYDRYTQGGFKRLMKNGFECKNAQIHYLPTFTAPGHASIYTGSSPALHGIVANDWVDRLSGASTYCTQDTSVSPIGSANKKAGKQSPRNLLATTITDELRLATNFKSRVFGISLKDRGSILPAGHTGNFAFWYDDKAGILISSSYYGNALPTWMQEFNSRNISDSLLAIAWNTLYPIESYTKSTADNSPYEGKLKGEQAPVFPRKPYVNKEYSELRKMPAGNTYTFLAAKACIVHEQLGQKGATDFLAVSFSTPDYAGHLFGPNAIEIEDLYLRFDKEMGEFLSFLDQQIGQGKYTVFLTADHGGAHNAQYLKDHKIPAGLEFEAPLVKGMNAYAKQNFLQDSLIESASNYQIHLSKNIVKRSNKDVAAIKASLIQYLMQQPEVSYAIDLARIDNYAVPEPLRTMIINGYREQRSGDIQIVLNPAWYDGYAQTGTTHGSWNPYDSHIPLIFFGWGVQKGATHRKVWMNDIAPTIAALLHIQEPNACTGNVITEVLKK